MYIYAELVLLERRYSKIEDNDILRMKLWMKNENWQNYQVLTCLSNGHLYKIKSTKS